MANRCTIRRQGRAVVTAARLRACMLLAWAIVVAPPSARAECVWIADELTDPGPAEPCQLGDPPALSFLAEAEQAQFQQQLTPRIEAGAAPPTPSGAQRSTAQTLASAGLASGLATPTGVSTVSFDQVLGAESAIRVTTDAGDLLGSSPQMLNLGVQRRNPVVTDPRVRGSRVGSLAASGSYWVPARIDLDTMASKLDSRIVESTTVIPGPYSSLYGPGFQFVDVQLQPSPRFDNGFEAHGQTSLDYKTNGEQWYGRQSFWGGDDVWGFRGGYGHRTGSDYDSGDGTQIPSSYKSRDVDLALGAQLTDTHSFDAHALRLDQTDVELAGQAFDIDWLVTDGYEVEYFIEDAAWADFVEVDTWYNRTRFEGSTSFEDPAKRAQFPFFESIALVGFTDVDSLSTGYRLASHWDGANDERLIIGSDLRYVKQETNEITSGVANFIWEDQNSPIPRSYWSNPGLFAEASAPLTEQSNLAIGGRVDYSVTNVIDDAEKLSAVGIDSELSPLSAADIWGSDDVRQNDLLGMAFVSVDAENDAGWGAAAKVGYGERAPTLTERYAIETFMFLIQNGLNTVTGDPELDKERVIQSDLTFSRRTERFRGDVTGFYAWARDYVTFEALEAVPGPPNGDIQQLSLKYVNTDRATLWGWEARAEYDLNDLITPFATLKYVEGDDRSRNGTFDTVPADPGVPSRRVAGIRGTGSMTGVAPVNEEPLPSILPLESRLGVRLEDPRNAPLWGLELYARVVDNQTRVAASLLETPTPGFTVWDLRTFVRPTDQLMLVAGVENFTDKNFREHLDFRSPDGLSVLRSGVTFYFGSELTY